LVFRYAREIGNRYAEMVHELERLEQLEGGELRVHALVHVGASLVMPAVERFVAEHPQVELQLSFDDSPLDFYKGGLDLAVTVGLPRAPQLVVHKLCPNDVCIVAAPRLAARHKTPTTPTDLLSWPLVAYKSGDVEVTTWPYEQDGAIHALEIKPNVTVNNGESLRVAVLRGLGVGYLSRFSAMAELRCGDLVELLPEVTLPPYESVYTVKSDVALVSPRVEAFEACLRSVALELT
ncbi:MAG: substrate binding domain-containing protein, partial [Myxococcota bacterium]